MPCFKGLAVSIHTPEGPLPEHSIQKQTRVSRITSYIPVPPPKIASTSNKPEPSSFAISITLLTPGLSVPYSTPKPTSDTPYPKPKLVGSLPGIGPERGRYTTAIGPYEPLTSSPNETIAAYIYFDGRTKEEVATLLRRGEETWVNSRWVGVPESEGGGLAEREFLFREVGLERWLNGLDLEGKDAAATIEKRRRKMEKKRRKPKATPPGSDDDGPAQWRERRTSHHKRVLKYGDDQSAPLEKLSDDDEMDSSSDEDSDDDPIPEATGQIKVALFRVLASGEIKKGEYSPQFDAHDDDEDGPRGGEGGDADIDHTTSFAKPKTLDPKSISTQTVTGIDGPDKPYAVFTFLYRGEKQLQKMGILKPKQVQAAPAATPASKRRSVQADIANLKPLKPGAALGFTGIRDGNSPRDKNGKAKGSPDDMDSDDDGPNFPDEKADDADDEDIKNNLLSPEDAKKQGEIADGVERIRLKRQHSVEPTTPSEATGTNVGKSPKIAESSPSADPTQLLSSTAYDPLKEADGPDPSIIGSPLKKPRASSLGIESEFRRSTSESLARGLGFGYTGSPLKPESGAGSNSNFGGALADKPADTSIPKESAESEPKPAVKEQSMGDEEL